MADRNRVSVIRTDCYSYPDSLSYFRPDTKYPEYDGMIAPSTQNKVYGAVRDALFYLGLDAEHFNTTEWNPLGEIIKPGMCVLIKPNMVLDRNQNQAGGTDCLYTHPSVVAPIIDYILLALKGQGKVVIGDAPMQDCNFDKLIAESGYADLAAYYRDRGTDIELVDFRSSHAQRKQGISISQKHERVAEIVVNLGKESEFYGIGEDQERRLRVTNYDPRIIQKHHCGDVQEYSISKYVLDADVIINMPKPKTHRKAGVTISLKNFVGTNAYKEFLPHHTLGANSDHGDEYLRRSKLHGLRSYFYDKINMSLSERHDLKARWYSILRSGCSAMMRFGNNPYSEGSWHGNRTISRTITDINKIIYFADKNGTMRDSPCREILIVADMIVSGEKEGPVAPSPKEVGIIAAGLNPVCFDETIATIMGMDIEKIPTLQSVRKSKSKYRLIEPSCQPIISSNDAEFNGKRLYELNKTALLNFIPTDGWKGHVELNDLYTQP